MGYVNHLEGDGQSHGMGFTSLPWSHTLTATSPGVIAPVVAQGDSDTIGCRIVVNGELRTEAQSSNRLNAQTYCSANGE